MKIVKKENIELNKKNIFKNNDEDNNNDEKIKEYEK